jgi:DNA-binding CsgD family transcriptional regulator
LRSCTARGDGTPSQGCCSPRTPPRSTGSAERYYLFLLERAASEQSTLCLVFRQFKLTNREQEITRLLLADQSNKEIAAALGLSLNTVKVYLKLLTRKLGVTSRIGILARVLSGEELAKRRYAVPPLP